MTRHAFTFLAAAAASLAAAPQEPTFHGRTDVVSVYVTVVDRGGRLVTNLNQNDFEVFDNGQRQNLSLFAHAIQPITIVVMLDRSGSMKRNFDLVRDAAERFVLNLLPSDKARIGSFSDHVRIDPEAFSSDRDELVRILHENLQDAGATPLWNATNAAMTALSREEGRRVVLLFTDGADSPSAEGPNLSLKDVLDRSQTDETMIYAIGLSDGCGMATLANTPSARDSFAPAFQRGGGGPGRVGGGLVGGGLGPSPGDGRLGGGGRPAPPIRGGRLGSDDGKPCTGVKPDPGLKELADEGGGAYFELRGTDDLRATFARVADELHHQYLLAFKAPAFDGQMHNLDVRVRRSNAIVRARRSYLAPH